MTEPRMRNRIEVVHDLTVSDLVQWCLQRGIDPDTATVTGGHVRWQSPETDAEREQAERYWAEQQARKDRWERETYERLRAKFETVV